MCPSSSDNSRGESPEGLDLFYRNEFAEELVRRWYLYIIEAVLLIVCCCCVLMLPVYLSLYLETRSVLYLFLAMSIPLTPFAIFAVHLRFHVNAYIKKRKEYGFLFDPQRESFRITAPDISKTIPLRRLRGITLDIDTTVFHCDDGDLVFDHTFLIVDRRKMGDVLKGRGLNIKIDQRFTQESWRRHCWPVLRTKMVYHLSMGLGLALPLLVLSTLWPQLLFVVFAVLLVMTRYMWADVRMMRDTVLNFITPRGLYEIRSGMVAMAKMREAITDMYGDHIAVSFKADVKVFRKSDGRLVKVRERHGARLKFFFDSFLILDYALYALEAGTLEYMLTFRHVNIKDAGTFTFTFSPLDRTLRIYEVSRGGGVIEERPVYALRYDPEDVRKYLTWILHRNREILSIARTCAVDVSTASMRGDKAIFHSTCKTVTPARREKQYLWAGFALSVLLFFSLIMAIFFMMLSDEPVSIRGWAICASTLFIFSFLFVLAIYINDLRWASRGIKFEKDHLVLWNGREIPYSKIRHVAANPHLNHISLNYVDEKGREKRVRVPPQSSISADTRRKIIETFRELGVRVLA